MKRITIMIAAAALMMTLIPTQASAWYCRADSPSASGWGSSPSRGRAAEIAIRQCAVRTPQWQVCQISRCR